MFAGAPHPHAPGGFPAAATLSPAAAGPSRAIRALAAGLALALSGAAPQARAQTAQAETASRPAEVSQVTVTGARPQAKPCPGAPSNATSGVDCAAARLGQAATAAQASAHQSSSGLILTAKSPDVAVGVVNTTALAEQFGANLGKSVHPYRPAPPPVSPSSVTRRP